MSNFFKRLRSLFFEEKHARTGEIKLKSSPIIPETFRLGITFGTGGTVVSVLPQHSFGDSDTTRVYVVPESEDLAQQLAHILLAEGIKRY